MLNETVSWKLSNKVICKAKSARVCPYLFWLLRICFGECLSVNVSLRLLKTNEQHTNTWRKTGNVLYGSVRVCFWAGIRFLAPYYRFYNVFIININWNIHNIVSIQFKKVKKVNTRNRKSEDSLFKICYCLL